MAKKTKPAKSKPRAANTKAKVALVSVHDAFLKHFGADDRHKNDQSLYR